ncbi:MAG: hypothetical protein AMXMBFR84_31170 [Candidatus Hydrogenedentota bacterium]
MRRILFICAVLAAWPAYPDLQNFEIGGSIAIRGRWFHNSFNPNREVRIPRFFTIGRPLGPQGANSAYAWDNHAIDRKFVEMDTRIHVRADFTTFTAALVEIESYDVWGEDFRSNWQLGSDSRSVSVNDVEILQAYVEADEIYGAPIRLRVGRQRLRFDDGWLVSDKGNAIRGLSFDGARLTWSLDPWLFDAFWTRIGNSGPVESDGNTGFAGVRAEYSGFDSTDVSAYWYWLRDARSQNDTNFAGPLEMLEDVFGLDNYDPSNLHTMGIFVRGDIASWDYALHAAYQFGEADAVGASFRPFLYGDNSAQFDAFAGDIELGYTFDASWSPRLYVGGAYIGGEDNRDLSFQDWMDPLDTPEASVSFVRLFSENAYTNLFDNEKSLSNFWQVRAGIVLEPVETISISLEAAHYEVLDPFDMPWSFRAARFEIPIAPSLSFLTKEASNELGDAVTLRVTYAYSDNVTVSAGWEHLFSGEALGQGAFVRYNGSENIGGKDSDDADYFFLLAALSF